MAESLLPLSLSLDRRKRNILAGYLTGGTRLVANYRRQAHACMVEKRDEGGGVLFVLEDGRKFKSASAAASAVMGGKAVNGWRFWSVQGTKPKAQEGGETRLAYKGSPRPDRTKGTLRNPLREPRIIYRTNLNLIVKVRDFVKSGGPCKTELRTFRWEVRL